ncbi:MAG: ATP-binding cassette domain-containing protein [Candidatus Omnitrophica bacterium]|nr:ATP-binding cassette domain-containing protein [Candidatus Omnitrophota bacterium]
MLRLNKISKYYQLNKSFISAISKKIKAVDSVCLEIKSGQTLGLVGESGCGKSTLARIILKLISPSSGQIFFQNQEITDLTEKQFRVLRQKIQIVFQDPYSSLSPRLTVKNIIAEPLQAFKQKKKLIEPRVRELLLNVGLNPEYADRLPHQLSGGERQRVGIARALATNPELLILDEAVSSLDLSTQAQVLNLLKDLQAKYKLTYLFIAHNLDVVRYISDHVAVMYKGRIVEQASVKQLYENPLHPYTRILLNSMPSLEKKLLLNKTQTPNLENQSLQPDNQGCCFYAQCNKAKAECAEQIPELKQIESGHWLSCFKPKEV